MKAWHDSGTTDQSFENVSCEHSAEQEVVMFLATVAVALALDDVAVPVRKADVELAETIGVMLTDELDDAVGANTVEFAEMTGPELTADEELITAVGA